uniref:Lipocalin/cytosolic fatty-acid binding domain-containing protein n=1 Tax=Vombatus ursinus TaxID=29139 RepID=A0A4X2KKD8_VOMUR
MKVLFLIIALSLFSILQAEESSPSKERFEGTYFIKAMVTDNEFHGKKKPKEVTVVTVTHLSDGDLEANFTSKGLGMLKIYLLTISTDEGKRQVLIQKTSVKDHWILLCETELSDKRIKRVKLLEENPQGFEEYKKFVSLKGFNETKISIPTQAETCTPEHD